MRALIVLALLAQGCLIRPCDDGTLFIELTMSTAATHADQLQFDATYGGQHSQALVRYTSGATTGTVQLDFPHGYPRGLELALTVTALQGASILATGSTSARLSGSCARISVALADVTANGPDGGNGGDLAAAADAAVDAAVDDGATDLAPPLRSLDGSVGAPLPVATSLSPASVIVGAGATKLTVTGSGFVATSQITFNNTAATTTFVDASHVSATLTSAQLATIATIQVRVVTPAPGGGTSAALPFAVSCQPITSGLLAHWTMDTSSISGTTLADSSGNHNDGTLSGFTAPVTVTGELGQALSYPASGSAHVAVPSIALDLTAGHTNSFSFWFYRAAGSVNDVLFLLPSPYGSRYDLWLTGSAGQFLCFNSGNNDCFGVQNNNLIGRWVHVVALFGNGSTATSNLYIDGVQYTPSCLTGSGFEPCQSSTAGLPVSLGGDTDFYFHGLFDEVRVYDRALTASEVTTLYSGNVCP